MNFIKILLNLAGTVGERLKYGEESRGTVVMPMVAGTILKAKSGRFVTLNTAGHAYLTSAADTTIFGSVEGGYDVTCSATAGQTKLMVKTDTNMLYRIPVLGSAGYSHTLRGVCCDLATSAGLQQAALATTAGGHVLIVDGDEDNSRWVIVNLNGKCVKYKTAA